MACNKCEKLGEENTCDPKQFCKCDKDWQDKVIGVRRPMSIDEADDIDRMVKTLTREPTLEVKDFYAEITAKIALGEIEKILAQYRNKDREFITYEELQSICSKGLKK